MSDPQNHKNGSIVNATARVATQVVQGFTGNPAMLLVVILNLLMVGSVSYYFSALEGYRRVDRQEFMALLSTCMGYKVEP